MKNPPSKEYLLMDRPIVDFNNGYYIQTISEKCSCPSNKGQWVVEWDQRFYPFTHANNLQKDIWLGGAKTANAKEKRMEMLRWYCHCCYNIQMP